MPAKKKVLLNFIHLICMLLGNVIRVSTMAREPHVNPLHAGWHEGQLWVHYSSGSSFASTFSF